MGTVTNHTPLPDLLLGMPAVISSDPMRQLLGVVERVSRSNAAVLISGESGSGKELIARALHHYSLRCTKPWVDVNCAALPEHLVESELFGYEKGAFSSADAAKPGLFELAYSGTLFLDEIGELSPRAQVKLLRVLDGVPYYRLGGTRKHSADVRIVAATNQDLQQAVQEGRFRKDLYHRLDQIHLRVPPLRERRGDILPLAEFFLRQNDSRQYFSEEAQQLLLRYAWPGNVRELRNAVIKSAILSTDLEICAAHLPEELKAARERTEPIETPSFNLEKMEQRVIVEVLAQTGGHHQKAAELLGISRRTLSRKLKVYRMEPACPGVAE